ncbi:pilin N-terminal domain-containing protein [Ligilactobacillus agilis]|nr:pilin N-terminal domain-containing protein [Ligilactobacillus agilis]
MKQSRIIAGLMLSTTVLTLASPVAAATNTPANNSEAVSTKQVDKSAATLITTDETGATSSTTNDKIQTLTEQTMILHKIIAKDGTVKAIVKSTSSAESSSKTLGLTQDKFQGVNGAKFIVYDITDLMNEVIKEKLQVANKDISSNQVDEAVEAQAATNSNEDSSQTEVTKAIPTVKPYVKVTNPTEKSSSSAATSDSTTSSKVDAEKRTESSSSVVSVDTSSKTSSETNNSSTDKIDPTLLSQIEALRKDDSLRKELAERASKLDSKQLKEFATVTTEHNKELNEEGVATVKMPLDGKYHAYYVVNTETPKEAHATNAKPIVVLTPVTDEQGLYADSFTVFPKSDEVPEEKQPQDVVTSEKMYQTGKQHQGLLKQLVQFSKRLFKLFQ